MRTLIKNAKIVTAEEVIEGCCAYTDGIIDYVGKDAVDADAVIDANGGYLVPGFIDIHCHGGNNLEFMDAGVEGFGKIAEFHKSHGTTTLFPTTLAAEECEIIDVLENFKKSILAMIGAFFLVHVFKRLKHKIDPRSYAGATFLGLRGFAVKTHGNSDALSLSTKTVTSE